VENSEQMSGELHVTFCTIFFLLTNQSLICYSMGCTSYVPQI